MAINNPLLNVLNTNSTNPVDLLRDIKVPPQPKRFGDRFRNMTPEKKQGLSQMLYLLGGALKGNDMSKDMAMLQQSQAIRKAEADQAGWNKTVDQMALERNPDGKLKYNASQIAILRTPQGRKAYTDFEVKRQFGGGKDGSTLITNANFLNELRTQLRLETDSTKKENLQQQINDVMGLGSVGKYDPKITYDKKVAETLATQGLSFGERPMNKGEISTDEKFATIYTKYIDEGRGAKNIANLEKLEDAQIILEAAAKNGVAISGVTAGMLSGFPKLSAYFNEQGLMVEERIASVIQQSLKEILGGQFSEKEGEALIRRGYNPNLSPEENLERLLDLYAQSEQLIETEKESVYHWENNNNSMRGYKGKTYTQESFIRDLSKDYLLDAKDLDSIEIEDAYKKAKEYSLWESVLEKEILRRTGR